MVSQQEYQRRLNICGACKNLAGNRSIFTRRGLSPEQCVLCACKVKIKALDKDNENLHCADKPPKW